MYIQNKKRFFFANSKLKFNKKVLTDFFMTVLMLGNFGCMMSELEQMIKTKMFVSNVKYSNQNIPATPNGQHTL